MPSRIDSIYQKSPIWVQQIMTAIYGWYWYQRRYGKVFHKFVTQLRSQEHWSTEQYLTYQEQHLRKILDAAWYSSYYKEVFSEYGIRHSMSPFDALQQIPILTKGILHERGLDMLTKSPLPRDAKIFQSSGTTGTPIVIVHQRDMLQKGQAWIEARSRNWAGVNYRSRRVMFGSRKICKFEQKSPPFWRISPIENMAYMSVYHLSPEFLPSYIAFLRKYQPQVIMGYPSALYSVARHAITTSNFPAAAKAIITTSEAVTPAIQEALETVWRCQVYGTYGAVEHCFYASQCEYGNYHLSPEVGIIEILDQEGNPCPPGTPGIAVCTGLHEDLQPLIRYQIGDVLTLSNETECLCGRTLPRIESIEGRIESMCYLPDGRMTLRFDTVFKGIANIWEAQIIQENIDFFRIRVVPGDGFNEYDINLMLDNMRLHVGNVRVEIEPVEMIERAISGKFQAVVCNLSFEEIAEVAEGYQY